MTLWLGRKVVMCVGAGGVGKTTTAAAIGVAAAAAGRRTLVMTIDPARRLANAMGLEGAVGNSEHALPADALAQYGVELRAPLSVMMPDVKRTFDELIERFAPNEERKKKILANRFYQQFASVLAGSLEYAAVEKLYEVHASGRYDLIVVDTPPSQNAASFLEAPGRVLDFLENDSIEWFLKPYALAGRFSLRLLDFGTSFVLKTLGRVAGAETLRDLADFVLNFSGMYEGFRERSRGVKKLLASEELAFVLVTAPQPDKLAAMLRFREVLEAEKLRVRAVIVNRTRDTRLAEVGPAPLHAKVDALVTDVAARQATHRAIDEELLFAARSRTALDSLRRTLGNTPLVALPELPRDAHDLEALARLQQSLAVDTAVRAEG
jgi:anion-transporting  ArsA/GET3 family ATPase